MHATTAVAHGRQVPGSGQAGGIGTTSEQSSSDSRSDGSHGSPLVPPGLGSTEPGSPPGGLAALADESAQRDEIALEQPSVGSARPAGPAGPGTPCCGSSTDLGAGGIAPPSGGSSAPAVALPAFKLAAPAPTGLQLPAPILGRSVAFPEPFERPG